MQRRACNVAGQRIKCCMGKIKMLHGTKETLQGGKQHVLWEKAKCCMIHSETLDGERTTLDGTEKNVEHPITLRVASSYRDLI